jgi:hypothetical protein
MARPKGSPKLGGRRKGTPNKVNGAVKEAILNAFRKVGGESYLEKIATEDPKTFCTLLGKVVPTEIANADEGGFIIKIVR